MMFIKRILICGVPVFFMGVKGVFGGSSSHWPVALGAGKSNIRPAAFSKVELGTLHGCALEIEDPAAQPRELYCWGTNHNGAITSRKNDEEILSYGLTLFPVGEESVTDFAVSQSSTCALLSNDQIACRGLHYNESEKSEIARVSGFTEIRTSQPRLLLESQFHETFRFSLPGAEKPKAIFSQSRKDRYCVTTDSSAVYCWRGKGIVSEDANFNRIFDDRLVNLNEATPNVLSKENEDHFTRYSFRRQPVHLEVNSQSPCALLEDGSLECGPGNPLRRIANEISSENKVASFLVYDDITIYDLFIVDESGNPQQYRINDDGEEVGLRLRKFSLSNGPVRNIFNGTRYGNPVICFSGKDDPLETISCIDPCPYERREVTLEISLPVRRVVGGGVDFSVMCLEYINNAVACWGNNEWKLAAPTSPEQEIYSPAEPAYLQF